MHRLRCRFDGSIAASLCFFCCRFALCQALACRQMASYLVNRGVHGGLSNCQVTTSAAVMVKYRQRFCWKWKMSSTLSFPVFAGVERSSMHMHTYTTLLFCLRQHTISTVAGEYGRVVLESVAAVGRIIHGDNTWRLSDVDNSGALWCRDIERSMSGSNSVLSLPKRLP